VSKINSIANTDGQGRDDLTSDILDQAIKLKLSERYDHEPKAIQKLIENIVQSW